MVSFTAIATTTHYPPLTTKAKAASCTVKTNALSCNSNTKPSCHESFHFFSPKTLTFHTVADWYGLNLLYKHQWLWARSSETGNLLGSKYLRSVPQSCTVTSKTWMTPCFPSRSLKFAVLEKISGMRQRGLQGGKEKKKEGKAKLLQADTHESPCP